MADNTDKPKSMSETAAGMATEAARRTAETIAGFGRAAAERQTAMLGDVSRMFKDMRFPASLPDTGALMAAHRRNMDALSQANRMALEGAQAVARRHMEIMQQTMTELSETIQALGAPDAPQAKAAKQAELLKRAYERAVSNTRELSELIQQANGEALTLLNGRFSEAMEEVKQLIQKASPGSSSG